MDIDISISILIEDTVVHSVLLCLSGKMYYHLYFDFYNVIYEVKKKCIRTNIVNY